MKTLYKIADSTIDILGKTTKETANFINKQIEQYIAKHNFAKKSDLQTITTRLDKLEKKINADLQTAQTNSKKKKTNGAIKKSKVKSQVKSKVKSQKEKLKNNEKE